jgi:hypothetical protein
MGERVKSPMFETAVLVLLMLLVASAASAAWIAYSRAMVAHDAIVWLGAAACAYLASEVVFDGTDSL